MVSSLFQLVISHFHNLFYNIYGDVPKIYLKTEKKQNTPKNFTKNIF